MCASKSSFLDRLHIKHFSPPHPLSSLLCIFVCIDTVRNLAIFYIIIKMFEPKSELVMIAASAAAPVAPPAITQTLFVETHPNVVEKDKSIHSEHGIIHYPFYYGGLASAVSSCCTQPLGVRKSS